MLNTLADIRTSCAGLALCRNRIGGKYWWFYMQSSEALYILILLNLTYYTMNNIPFFEILVVLFVLWPLIERFLNKNKRRTVDPSEVEYEVFEDPNASKGSAGTGSQHQPEWDEALRELEMIFTGESKPRPPAQSPAPVASQAPAPVIQKSAPHPVSASASRSDKTPASFAKMRAVKMPVNTFRDGSIDSDNPIYQPLSKSPEVHEDVPVANFSIYDDVRSPKRLREFVVMKEVLDKPVSMRRNRTVG